jgi:hypothetical protein
MANRVRGDAELDAAGRRYTLRLTLGALAEIEDGLSLDDLSGIEARLKNLRAADLAIVLAALIRGGGTEMSAADALRIPAALPEIVRAVGEAFAAGGGGAEGISSGPFPGTPGSHSGSASCA